VSPSRNPAGASAIPARCALDVDVLTAEQRSGSPDDYCGHTLHVEPDGSFSSVRRYYD
jgi:hypothetical protein